MAKTSRQTEAEQPQVEQAPSPPDAAGPARPEPEGPAAADVGRRAAAVSQDVGRLNEDLSALAEETTAFLRHQLTRRPYLTLGAAAGLGYVLGGGIPRWMVRAALGLAVKTAVAAVVQEAAAGLFEAGRAEGESPERVDPNADA